MNNMLSFPRLALTTMMVGLAVSSFAQPSVQILSGPTAKTDMTAALSRGATMSQAVGPLFALDLDVLQAQAFNDKGVAAQRSMMSTVGASLKFTPFSPELQAVRPWAGAGVSWQTTKTHVDAKDANGSTYHLWNDGLLYDIAQPNPMPDIEFPSPLERDNVYETLVDQGARIAVPLKAGVDMQLTRRMHATVAVTAVPGAQGTWATAQAGIGFQLGRGKTYLKTLLPEAFLALGTDADGDGVKDTKDMCGGTEPGAIVDKHGCAIDTDADGVPDHRDLEINSPDLLVNDDGVSISLAEWKAMYAPEKGDPTTFVQDSATIISELTAAQMAQMLLNTGNTAAKAEQQLLHDLRERVYNPNVTYRVQYGAFLAAFAPSTDMYTHEAVQAIEGEHGLTLHVGKAYERLSEARNALAAAKAANHSDAFVTAYHNGVRVTLEEAAALEAMRNNSVEEAEEVFDVAAVKFHVQLGRYSAGVPVDVLNAFLQMGQIEQRMEADGTHRYLTAGVGAEDTARQHLASAQDLGFDDAFLVAEQDGNAISVAQAREAMNQIEATLMAAK